MGRDVRTTLRYRTQPGLRKYHGCRFWLIGRDRVNDKKSTAKTTASEAMVLSSTLSMPGFNHRIPTMDAG